MMERMPLACPRCRFRECEASQPAARFVVEHDEVFHGALEKCNTA
jgi:hypothetical protein